jgi:phenylacetate-CoA ligase
VLRAFNGYILFPILEKLSKRDIRSKTSELRNFDHLTQSSQNEVQKKELYKVLNFASSNCPYYKDLFHSHNFIPNKILKDIRYLQDLPLLTKEIIKEQTDRIKTTHAFHPRKTGGSTGQSVMFYYDERGLDWTSAINTLALEYADKKPFHKDMHISSELGITPPTLKAKFLDSLKLFSQNRKRLMIESFNDDELNKLNKSLSKYRPYLLQGHPSSAYAISSYVEKNNLPKKQLFKIFEPSGEMLTSKIVKSIEENLGAKVVNRYGNAEFGVVAHSRKQDSYNKLKVFNRAFYVEETNKSDLIVTNLTNYGMPLIKYNTGDIATVKNENDGTFIYDIQGRVHNNVEINGKKYATHFIMDFLDHKVKGVREFQVVKSEHDVSLFIVPENEDDKDRIRTMVSSKWPTGLNVDFIKYNQLKKVGWRQKFQHLIELN